MSTTTTVDRLAFSLADLPRRIYSADCLADLGNPGGKWCADILDEPDDDLAKTYALAAIDILADGQSLAYLAGIRNISRAYRSRRKVRSALAARADLLTAGGAS